MFQDNNGNYKLKIAFDFDGTLSEPDIFAFAQRLVWNGHDVWILTASSTYEQYKKACKNPYATKSVDREEYDSWNRDLCETAKKLGIEDKILFTGNEVKKDFFFAYGFDLIFDDDSEWHCNPI
jgi:hypothetical protein